MLKFFHATSIYPPYGKFITSKEGYKSLITSEDKTDFIQNDYLGWGGVWKVHLNKPGVYACEHAILNAEDIQKQWALENNFKYSKSNWQLEILKQQIIDFSPDVLFTHDYLTITPEFRKEIRNEVKNLKFIIGWDGIGFRSAERLNGCEMVLSCAKSILDFYEQNGFKTYMFNFGFEESILQRIQLNRNKYNLSFTGSVTVGNNMYNGRIALLAGLSRKLPVDYFLSSLTDNKIYLTKSILRKVKAGEWTLVNDVLKLIRLNKGPVFGMDMYQKLADSKFTFNTHGDIVKGEAANVRLFEATGVGTCLVTDWKPNLVDFFEPDKEVVTYKSLGECIEKMTYLMDHEDERKTIALAGHRRTIKEYSYEKRIADFVNFLLDNI